MSYFHVLIICFTHRCRCRVRFLCFPLLWKKKKRILHIQLIHPWNLTNVICLRKISETWHIFWCFFLPFLSAYTFLQYLHLNFLSFSPSHTSSCASRLGLFWQSVSHFEHMNGVYKNMNCYVAIHKQNTRYISYAYFWNTKIVLITKTKFISNLLPISITVLFISCAFYLTCFLLSLFFCMPLQTKNHVGIKFQKCVLHRILTSLNIQLIEYNFQSFIITWEMSNTNPLTYSDTSFKYEPHPKNFHQIT